MLSLQVIGYYGKYPTEKAASSCYIIKSNTTSIILDMGSAALEKLQKYIDPNSIDGIILSHLHGDHTADIFAFKNFALEFNQKRDAKVKLLLPQTPNRQADAIVEGDLFDVSFLQDKSNFIIGDIECEFFSMAHPIETYGVKFKSNGKTIAYTSDTIYNDNIRPLLENADLALVDACILDKEFNNTSKHISVKAISKLTNGIPAVLTHLFKGKETEIFEEAVKYNKEAQLAYEGLKIIL